MIDPTTLTFAVLTMMGAAVLLNVLPAPCKCEKCGFHVNETRMKAAADKEAKHESLHRAYDTCGDKTCPREHERHRSARIDE